MGKEHAEQSQILETIREKKENIKQEIRKTSLKGNTNDTEKYRLQKKRKQLDMQKNKAQIIKNYQK